MKIIGKDLEGGIHGLIEGLFRQSPGGTEENDVKPESG
jgi:hypothetical protein